MTTIYDTVQERLLKTMLPRIDNETTPANAKTIKGFVKYLTNERKSKGWIAMLVCDCIKFDNFFTQATIIKTRQGRAFKTTLKSRKKPQMTFQNVNRQDVEDFCSWVNNREELAERRKLQLKSELKMFYKWQNGGEEYPDIVRWIKGKALMDVKKFRTKARQDLLTEAEAVRILKACSNKQDEALFNIMIEAGLRPKEALMLKIKDIELSEDETYIHVPNDTKTGERTIPVISSRKAILEWINEHPFRADTNSWLFINQKSDDMRQICYLALRKRFKKLLTRAGIKKKISLYYLRHGSYTSKADAGFTESDIKLYHGLDQNTRVLSTYIHRDAKQLMDRMRELHGQTVEKKKHVTEIKIQTCPNCKTENSVGNTRCTKCGIIIDLKILNDLEKQKEEEKTTLQNQLNEIIKRLAAVEVYKKIGVKQ